MSTKTLLTEAKSILLIIMALSSFILPNKVSAANNMLKPLETKYGWVDEILDGKTIVMSNTNGSKLRVKLYGIDTPVFPSNSVVGSSNPKISGQFYSVEAKQFTDKLFSKVGKKLIRTDVIWIDYESNSVLAILYIDKVDVAQELIKAGFAEVLYEYIEEPYRSWYLNVEYTAKIARKGIWSLKDYERPSDFRKKNKIYEK